MDKYNFFIVLFKTSSPIGSASERGRKPWKLSLVLNLEPSQLSITTIIQIDKKRINYSYHILSTSYDLLHVIECVGFKQSQAKVRWSHPRITNVRSFLFSLLLSLSRSLDATSSLHSSSSSSSCSSSSPHLSRGARELIFTWIGSRSAAFPVSFNWTVGFITFSLGKDACSFTRSVRAHRAFVVYSLRVHCVWMIFEKKNTGGQT